MSQNTGDIYTKCFGDCLDKLMTQRNQWDNEQTDSSLKTPEIDFCKVWSRDYDTISFINEMTEDFLYDSLSSIVDALLETYSIKHETIPLSLVTKNFEYSPSFAIQGRQKAQKCYASIVTHNEKATLYIFKKFGIANRFSDAFISKLKEEHNFESFKFISWVDDHAYTEIINHDENTEDPSRGTNIYSLKYFFSEVFSLDEYRHFCNAFGEFKKTITQYYGVSVVKTLRPNNVYSYRKKVTKDLLSFDYNEAVHNLCGSSISTSQYELILHQFGENKYCNVLSGNESFSKCFMTSEWFFNSLFESADYIDLTSISMGYFKALEQFLYVLLGKHLYDTQGKNRRMNIGNANNPNWILLTGDSIKRNKNKITLGSLVYFFWNPDNEDLFRTDIDTNTKNIFKRVILKANDQRNGYFHKDNITSWEKVKNDRNLIYVLFFLLLGGFEYTESDLASLGMPCMNIDDDKQKLCNYLHNRSINHDPIKVPILWLGDSISETQFVFIDQNNDVTFDLYGNATYSGIKYHFLGSDSRYTLNLSDIPNTIYEAYLDLKDLPIIKISDERIKIWENGRFLM